MNPSIGRIVLLHRPREEAAAAIVTRVNSDRSVNLTSFRSGETPTPEVGSFLHIKEASSGYGWSWPPRVEEEPSGEVRGG